MATVRSSVVSFLTAAVTAAAGSSPLYQIDVNDTPANPYSGNSGVTVFFPSFDLAPDHTGSLKEYNGVMTLLCYSRVIGASKVNRSAAYDAASNIAHAITALFLADPTIGGMICDARIERGEGGWDAEDGQPYMLVALTLLYSERGQVN